MQQYWSGLPFLLQRIFLTQGSNLCLLHCRRILQHLSHQGRPTPQQEACTLPLESSPYLPQLEKSSHGYGDPAQPKINKLKGKPKYLECCAENSEQSRTVAALLRKACFEGWHLGTWIMRRFPPLPQADSLCLICLCKPRGLC